MLLGVCVLVKDEAVISSFLSELNRKNLGIIPIGEVKKGRIVSLVVQNRQTEKCEFIKARVRFHKESELKPDCVYVVATQTIQASWEPAWTDLHKLFEHDRIHVDLDTPCIARVG